MYKHDTRITFDLRNLVAIIAFCLGNCLLFFFFSDVQISEFSDFRTSLSVR